MKLCLTSPISLLTTEPAALESVCRPVAELPVRVLGTRRLSAAPQSERTSRRVGRRTVGDSRRTGHAFTP